MFREKKNHVFIKHHSNDRFNMGTILKNKENFFSIKVSSPLQVYNYFETDPLSLTIVNGNNVQILEGTISFVDYANNTFEFNAKSSKSITDARTNSRFPTSLYAIVKSGKTTNPSYIRNISSSGLNLKSKFDYKIDSKLLIRTSICDTYINFECKIVWKVSSFSGFEYGVCLINTDDYFHKLLSQMYIDLVIQEHRMHDENYLEIS